jgi:MFS superfamily sulfate permease-like transporter
MMVLLFLTPVFERMPYCVMAAVIIGGVSTLIEVRYAIELFRTDLRDFLVFLVTFCVVIFYSIDIGLGVGIGISLFLYILETGFPSKQRLGRLVSSGSAAASASPKATHTLIIDAKDTRLSSGSEDPQSDTFLDADGVKVPAAGAQQQQQPKTTASSNAAFAQVDTFLDQAEYGAHLRPLPTGVVAVRVQASIAFNNVQALEDFIEDIVTDTEDAHLLDPVNNPLVSYVILDMVAAGHIDSSGCHSIGTEVGQRMADKGVQVVLVSVNKRILRSLERSGALSKGNLRPWIFTSLSDAVAATQRTKLVLTERAKAEDEAAAQAAELAAKKTAAKEAKLARRAARRSGGDVAAAATTPATAAVATGVV